MSIVRTAVAVGALLIAAGQGLACNSDPDEKNPRITSGIGASAEESGDGSSGSSSGGEHEATGPGTGSEGSSGPSTCERPPGAYGDCINEGAGACMDREAACMVNRQQDPLWGACFRPCESDCDCWAESELGSAPSQCALVLQDGKRACVLNCSDSGTCPEGMRCIGLTGVTRACVYDREGAA